jgi:uncharacterized protein YciI
MTNTALNTRIAFAPIFASAALAGVSYVERCGVVLRRSEYTQPRHLPVQSPLINTKAVRRVVFVVRLDGGIGSEIVTIDQTLDAVSALVQEGDQVSATIVDDLHIESTVNPIFPWGFAVDLDSLVVSRGTVLRRGEFLDSNGGLCVASLVLATAGLVVDVQSPVVTPASSYGSPAYFTGGAKSIERCGVVLRRSEYTQPRHVPVQSPLINTKDVRRVVFVVRLDGGIGSELITIDQTLDAVSALIEEGDQVSANIVDDVHIESTVNPIFQWGSASDLAAVAISDGKVLRRGEFQDSKGVPSIASLILAAGASRGLVVDVQRQ